MVSKINDSNNTWQGGEGDLPGIVQKTEIWSY